MAIRNIRKNKKTLKQKSLKKIGIVLSFNVI